jgi:hypothetical protein
MADGGATMNEGAELLLSASSIKTYMDCGYKYLLEHVWRLPAAPNMDMAIGTAVHAGVEAMHKGLDPREQGELATFSLDREWAGDDMGFTEAEKEVFGMMVLYRKNIAPTFHPTLIEKDFVIRVDGTLVSGRIDAADEDVHDTKTTANLSKFRPERHRF